MSLSHRYRNFGGTAVEIEVNDDLSAEIIEDQKLRSFEEGYQAGWDDAVKAQADASMKISSEFGQNLQDMSFTYQEALSKLTASMKPVLLRIVEKFLPSLTREALGAHIVEELHNLVKENATQPIEIVVAPGNAEVVKEIGEENLTSSFKVYEESSLGQGQAFVRIGSEERSIDLDSVVFGCSAALKAFFHETALENKDE